MRITGGQGFTTRTTTATLFVVASCVFPGGKYVCDLMTARVSTQTDVVVQTIRLEAQSNVDLTLSDR